jgi:hypothetical protein
MVLDPVTGNGRWRFPWLLGIALVLCGPLAHAGGLAPIEGRKIAFLISAIETLANARFVRNGTAYDGREAADHLRLKLKMARSRVRTADDFIRLCASVSSISGRPYEIRFADGHIVTAEAYLRERLTSFRE